MSKRIGNRQARKLIYQVQREEVTRHTWGDTNDIINTVVSVCNKDHLKDYILDFAQKFKGKSVDDQYSKLKQLWHFCRFDIIYEKDPDGYQFIKHPHRTFWDSQNGDGADCKSLSIFIYFVCRCIDIPCFLRFSSYKTDKEIGHVYPVAILPGGRTVPIDSVYKQFDAEEKPTSVRDRFTRLYNSAAIRRNAKEAKSAALYGFSNGGSDQWVTGILSALSFYNATKSKGLVSIGQFMIGGYFAYQTLKE